MTLEEVQIKLHELGIDIPGGTLRRWASIDVISSPDRVRGAGQRGGWHANWSDISVWEAAAAYFFREMRLASIEEIADIRAIGRFLLSSKNELAGHIVHEVAVHDFADASHPVNRTLTWLSRFFKAKQGFKYGNQNVTTWFVSNGEDAWIEVLENMRSKLYSNSPDTWDALQGSISDFIDYTSEVRTTNSLLNKYVEIKRRREELEVERDRIIKEIKELGLAASILSNELAAREKKQGGA